MTVVSASGAEPEVSRAGSWDRKIDMKWGEQGQTRTHIGKLGSQRDEGD